MNELQLIQLWQKLRNQIIFAQLAPTFLLITSVGLLGSIDQWRSTYALVAVIGILLASGILGALAEFTAANEAQAVAREIAKLPSRSALSESIIKTAPWMHVVKYLTPAIFVVIFIGLIVALHS